MSNNTDAAEEQSHGASEYLGGMADTLRQFGDYIWEFRLNPNTNREELDNIPIRELVTVFGAMADRLLKAEEQDARREESTGADSTGALEEYLKNNPADS